jgi:prepilin-type N-terminal cleavage/methylation domain-containing protein
MIDQKKSSGGFTLIELIIVIVIISILALVSVPIYRGYTRRAMASEGAALCGSVATTEKVWFAEHGVYRVVAAGTGFDTGFGTLDIDARNNAHFRTFGVANSAGGFTVTCAASAATDASGITVQLIQGAGAPVLTMSGL